MAERILLVEDEQSVSDAVSYSLEREGFEVLTAADGQTALQRFEDGHPDLVVLDLMLPGINGWELLQAFRKQRPAVPVIMLTARAEETDRVAGLELGADDYVTKPFSMRELTARVRAVLRRLSTRPEESLPVLTKSGIRLDADRHEVTVDGKAISLSPKEFDLLAYLMRHSGRVRNREDILQAVWGSAEFVDERTVDVHIRWLRLKIEADPVSPRRLLTVRGVGYKFAETT